MGRLLSLSNPIQPLLSTFLLQGRTSSREAKEMQKKKKKPQAKCSVPTNVSRTHNCPVSNFSLICLPDIWAVKEGVGRRNNALGGLATYFSETFPNCSRKQHFQLRVHFPSFPFFPPPSLRRGRRGRDSSSSPQAAAQLTFNYRSAFVLDFNRPSLLALRRSWLRLCFGCSLFDSVRQRAASKTFDAKRTAFLLVSHISANLQLWTAVCASTSAVTFSVF